LPRGEACPTNPQIVRQNGQEVAVSRERKWKQLFETAVFSRVDRELFPRNPPEFENCGNNSSRRSAGIGFPECTLRARGAKMIITQRA
jgi:hypothetical protein